MSSAEAQSFTTRDRASSAVVVDLSRTDFGSYRTSAVKLFSHRDIIRRIKEVTEQIQSWIRALWPMIVSVVVIILFIKDMQRDNDIVNAVQNERLDVIEECQQDMSAALDELSEQQSITNSNIATLNTNVTSILRLLENNFGQ